MFPPSIGILIENPSFVSNYTAFENLKTLASIRRRIDDNRIRETLTEIGLDPDDKRTFHKFSLGMKQRLGIAAAIMENPDIIILDEPINALDDTGTEQIRDILIRHRERGALIIIACHDADELNFLSMKLSKSFRGRLSHRKMIKNPLKILTYHHYTYKVVLKGTALFIYNGYSMKSTKTR